MSRRDEILLNTFLEAAGGGWRGVALDDLLTLLAAALEERKLANTATASQATGGGEKKEKEGIASKVLGTAFGMAPVAKALFSIFGGGDDKEPPPPLVRFALPPSLRFEAANRREGVTGLDYGQQGLPRAVVRGPATKDGRPVPRVTEADEGSAFDDAQAAVREWETDLRVPERWRRGEATYAEPERSTARQPAQVTIQVQAMDSRSFLDHSAEIAQAVREAMLNMHALNDVVNDI